MRIYRLLNDQSSSSGATPVLQKHPNTILQEERGRKRLAERNSQSPTERADEAWGRRQICYNFETAPPPEEVARGPVRIAPGRTVPTLSSTSYVPTVQLPPAQSVPPVATPAPGFGPAGVFSGIPVVRPPLASMHFGHADALPPIPETGGTSKILASIGRNIDRLANPDVSAKPGTIDGLKRNEEIWAYVARPFNNYGVAFCPGVTGKQLALGLKALNDRIRPLYDSLELPCGFANRLGIGAAALTRGARTCDPDRILCEQDFAGWDPNQFDVYQPPNDWALGAKTRAPAHIETWRINALNMHKMFSLIYGAGHLGEGVSSVEDLRALHVREPRKYTLVFIRNSWNALNHRWIQEIKEKTNILRLHAHVERPTYDQLKSVGMIVDPATGRAIFQQ